MTERRRAFSPKYKPLMEESGESPEETRLTRESSPVNSSTGALDQECMERVMILSDHDGDRGNGDADSGISLSDVVGEEHPISGRVCQGDKPESLVVLVLQIVIPFFFAGFGMMAAGLLLDAVQVSEEVEL